MGSLPSIIPHSSVSPAEGALTPLLPSLLPFLTPGMAPTPHWPSPWALRCWPQLFKSNHPPRCSFCQSQGCPVQRRGCHESNGNVCTVLHRQMIPPPATTSTVTLSPKATGLARQDLLSVKRCWLSPGTSLFLPCLGSVYRTCSLILPSIKGTLTRLHFPRSYSNFHIQRLTRHTDNAQDTHHIPSSKISRASIQQRLLVTEEMKYNYSWDPLHWQRLYGSATRNAKWIN